jgi:hypothetical protein
MILIVHVNDILIAGRDKTFIGKLVCSIQKGFKRLTVSDKLLKIFLQIVVSTKLY